jgi:hypothetical protein
MPSWTRIFLLWCFAVVPALSQPVSLETETIRANALLDSSKPADRAWGAYLAGNLRLEACQGKIVDLLRGATLLNMAVVDGENYAYVQSLLDALIQLDVKLDKDDVLPFSTTWPAETIILLARQAKANEQALLALRNQRLTYYEWMAIDNLLLGVRSPQFFVETFKKLPAWYHFTVVDRELKNGGTLGGMDGELLDSTRDRRFPPGFPPAAVYDFTLLHAIPVRDAVFLADGPQVSYYRRLPIDRAYQWTREDHGARRLGSGYGGYEKEYLARLSRYEPDRIEHIFHPSATLYWTGAESFSVQVKSLMDGQSIELQKLVGDAQTNLRAQFPEFQIQVKANFYDLRDDKTTPLPAAPVRDLTLP